MDQDRNNYVKLDEFVKGFTRLYCSDYDEKINFVFEMYDFDNDGKITEADIHIFLAILINS